MLNNYVCGKTVKSILKLYPCCVLKLHFILTYLHIIGTKYLSLKVQCAFVLALQVGPANVSNKYDGLGEGDMIYLNQAISPLKH